MESKYSKYIEGGKSRLRNKEALIEIAKRKTDSKIEHVNKLRHNARGTRLWTDSKLRVLNTNTELGDRSYKSPSLDGIENDPAAANLRRIYFGNELHEDDSIQYRNYTWDESENIRRKRGDASRRLYWREMKENEYNFLKKSSIEEIMSTWCSD